MPHPGAVTQYDRPARVSCDVRTRRSVAGQSGATLVTFVLRMGRPSRGQVVWADSKGKRASLTMLFFLPGEDRRDGIVPDRSDDDTSQTGDPPDLILGEDIPGNAHIRDRSEG